MVAKIKIEKIVTDKKYIALLAIFCTFLWGSAYPAIKLGYELFNIPPKDSFSKLLFAGYRFLLAGLMIMIIQKAMGKRIRPKSLADLKPFIVLGIVHTLMQYVFLYIGMANTSGVKSSILGSVGVFISVILAHLIYKDDKLSLKRMAGCMIGFSAVIVINLEGGGITASFTLVGDGLIILSAAMGSIGSIYNKKLVKTNDVLVTTGWQLIWGSLMLIVIGKSAGGTLRFTSVECGVLLLYMALLSSVALVIWSVLYKYNKVGEITIYTFLMPVFGALLSALLLEESIAEIKNGAALALACAGIWIVNRKGTK